MPGGKIDILVEPDVRGFPNKLASGLRGASGVASSIGRGLGLALAAGTAAAAVGLKSVIELGNDYTANLNEMQSVSNATALEMQRVADTAKALGSDMTLPATSAADAAAAMVELAKGGLSVTEAMDAAKGTLQLAAAAQVDGATAAELQANALNSFGLQADQAGRVADVLANAANAAAGSMIDIGNSLKYIAPVAAALKISIEDTAAAIGLLANQGIKGEQAGTSLRGILASLASPSAAAAEAMKELGLTAFDAQGKFVGLRVFTDQLAQAKKRLTDAEFAAAASTAFGNEGFTAANALAAEGAVQFDAMAKSVSRAGGAADVAAAQTKGLGGAWEGFKSQLETAGIEVYEVIAPGLEQATRAAAGFVERFTPTVVGGLQTAISAGEVFGPGLADAIQSRGDTVLTVIDRVVDPVRDAIVDSLNSAVNLGVRVFGGFADVVREGARAVDPLATAVGDVVESINEADGPVGALGVALDLVYDGAAGLLRILSPVTDLVGDAVGLFAALPGPIQTAAVALLALRVGPQILSGLRNALGGAAQEAGEASRQTGLLGRSMGLVLSPVRLAASGLSSAVGTMRQFSDEARVQSALSQAAGDGVGRLGGAVAAFNTSTIPAIAAARGFRDQTSAIRDAAAAAGAPIGTMGAAIGTLVERSPALSSMRSAFEDAAGGAERFTRTAGAAAAAGRGLRLAAGGLVSALGGPFGLILGGVSVGLGLLAGSQQDAAEAAADHEDSVQTLASALRESGGVIDDNVRSQKAQELQTKGTADAFAAAGVGLDELTAAALQQGDAYDNLKEKLLAIAKANSQLVANPESGNITREYNDQGVAALDLIKKLEGLAGQTDEARKRNAELEEALAEGGRSMLESSDSGRQFADAMKVLADETSSADDKARALKEALDSLSGGQINLEAAQADLNEQLAELSDLFGENLDKADGWGKALINADGSINTVLPNGRRLLDIMSGLGEDMATVAQRTYDAAIAQGADMPTALAKATEAAKTARTGFVAQAEAMGISTTKAEELADRYNLIPERVATLITAPGMDPTQVELILLRELVNKVPNNKAITVQSLSDAAKQKLIDLGFTVRTLPDGQVEVVAKDKSARDKLNRFVQDYKSRTFDWNVRITIPNIRGPGGLSSDGGFNALGNVVTAAYAHGGVHPKLTPMRAGIAAVVPPNSWRIVGDRLRDDEFYIPDDEAPRSIAIGREWARRRGFVLVRTFADGGVASTSGPLAPARQGAVNINMPVQVQSNRDAYEFAQVTSSTLAFQQRFGGGGK